MITTATGLQYEDTVVGDGAEATKGQTVTVWPLVASAPSPTTVSSYCRPVAVVIMVFPRKKS